MVALLLLIYGMQHSDSAVVCIVGDIERILFDWILLEQE